MLNKIEQVRIGDVIHLKSRGTLNFEGFDYYFGQMTVMLYSLEHYEFRLNAFTNKSRKTAKSPRP
jgi:hypothetical protein